ncbi:BTB/POZ domain-containing protein KCTD6-like [Acanthaster planci]|uniref:BTB/POZ domain-containing protein KCTD6-like n=1 Tax=Acanthaster planci TaxID=133434 RepID=A0A8B8A0K1_ACAPL|nr:BTB/POZ domain-containing protein KCTD6-like [Acanthaster planci]XP_022111284.1 BTB/POZ domain-containing protein KCTD6-like [Acanthaster planci]XP_022111285.1 BTB/POZ domain-containing protein KCTD6-like [Acanthaster planci]
MDDTVKLDVGGYSFTTTRATLTRYPDSLLGVMFTSSQDIRAHPNDDNEVYVIDGDGPIFRHVLNFLRRGKLALPENFMEWDLLISEADFYQLKELTDAARALMAGKDSLEFLEITVRGNHFIYTGTRNTLEQIPLLLQFLGRHDSLKDGFPLRRSDILNKVSENGRYGVSLGKEGCDCPNISQTRMEVFRQMSKLGFHLKAAPSASSDPNNSIQELTWTFTRKSHGRC